MDNIPRPRPKLMVVGDSLAQGCRSLSVTADFCAQSWPARVATQQGWEFATPDFPRPVLFQLEDEIHSRLHLETLITRHRFEGCASRLRENLAAWQLNEKESGFPCFDNVAVAGALIHDLYTRTAASSHGQVESLAPAGASLVSVLPHVPDLHVAVDARFVLNPSQDEEFAEFTQLDWVRARKPELLVVQIGHNHGLYAVGSQAVVPPEGVTATDPEHGGYFDQWAELARHLGDLPPEVGTILVCLLPKVGAVANLRPKGADRSDGYAPAYEPVFAVNPQTLAGPDLAAVDQSIRDANDRIREIVQAAPGAAGRVRFLDLFDLFDRLDFKNSRDSSRRVTVPGRAAIDNQYLDRTVLGLRLVAGGFQSADGMHATAAGYALLASEAMTALGLAHDRDGLLRQGFDDDRLLAHPSRNLDAVAAVLGLIRRTQLDVGLDLTQAVASDQLPVARVVQLAQAVFDRR